MSGILNVLEKEFMDICDLLEKTPERVKDDDILIITKKELKELLDRNKYEQTVRKIKYWKLMKWIRTDGRRLTKRIYDKSQKKYYPYIQIERTVYRQMKKLSLQKTEPLKVEEWCEKMNGGMDT